MAGKSIAKRVEGYVLRNPSIKYCLKHGLINFSSLARRITSEEGFNKKDFDAILIALRRYMRKIQSEARIGKKVREILSRSSLEIKTGIIVFILEKGQSYEDLEKELSKSNDLLHIIEGRDTNTLITTESFAPEISRRYKTSIVRETHCLAQILIKTSQAIETTPGIVAFLSSLLWSHGINIFEFSSTWTDTLFVLSEKDISKAMNVLKFS